MGWRHYGGSKTCLLQSPLGLGREKHNFRSTFKIKTSKTSLFTSWSGRAFATHNRPDIVLLLNSNAALDFPVNSQNSLQNQAPVDLRIKETLKNIEYFRLIYANLSGCQLQSLGTVVLKMLIVISDFLQQLLFFEEQFSSPEEPKLNVNKCLIFRLMN